MKWVIGLAAACVGIWLAVTIASPVHARPVFFGMLGPFAAVAGTWMFVERVARQNPAGLTAVMMTGFAVKMAFFALYVVAVMRLANVDRTAFTLSFAVSFIALYAIQALLLRRLVARLT